MSGEGGTLGAIAGLFLSVSLLAIGGVNSVLPEIHRQAVEVSHWLTDREFANLYAIALAAPGPNFLIVTLVGYRAAGVAGALVATIATIGPSSALIYGVAKAWDRFRGSAWRDALEAGVAPLTAGLVAASALVLVRAADTSVPRVAITLAAAGLALLTRINPLVVFGAAAVLGVLGLL